MISRPHAIATGILILLATFAHAGKHEDAKRVLAQQTTERMQSARLQELHFEDATVRDVIEQLVDMSRATDGEGFNILFMDGSKPMKKVPEKKVAAAANENWDKNWDELFGVKRVEGEVDENLFDPEKRITLRLRRVSMWD
ncbi:MAG: hypothetical protein ACI97B_002747, partial [Verrucomicrobiales bacterium]